MDELKKYKARLKIDEHALDKEWGEHPDLFHDVADAHALAISNRDEAKQELDELEALVDMQLRQAAAVSGDKTTETQIESNKKIDKRVIQANEKLLAEKYNAAQWAALKESFEQRSFALSRLVELYIANYYSSVEKRVPAHINLKDLRSDQVKQENARRRVQV